MNKNKVKLNDYIEQLQKIAVEHGDKYVVVGRIGHEMYQHRKVCFIQGKAENGQMVDKGVLEGRRIGYICDSIHIL